MLFNSLAFAWFFPLVTLLYFACPHRGRWLLLLLASCWFYMAFIPAYLLILLLLIVIDYSTGLLIARARGRARTGWLLVSIVANLGILGLFKYGDFVALNLTALAAFLGWNYSVPLLGLILPIGLSFHTFQSLSYVIEVYRGRFPAERHLGIYALYVMFYPQLVAGPIERPGHLLPQLRQRMTFDMERVASGARLMLWGFFKKVVIADRLAIVTAKVFANPQPFGGPPLALAAAAAAYQIYCDFSGYSDIARGAACIMGFSLRRNFDRPYSATTVANFWRRWHISLSSWFNDYVFLPLSTAFFRGTLGVALWPTASYFLALALTWFLCGLWHGANWTFIIWGLLQGAYLAVGSLLLPWQNRFLRATGPGRISGPYQLGQTVLTFGLIAYGWTWFFAASVGDALRITRQLPTGFGALVAHPGLLADPLRGFGLFLTGNCLVALLSIAVMELAQLGGDRGWYPARFNRLPWPIRWGSYYLLIFWVIILGRFADQKFIYFQF